MNCVDVELKTNKEKPMAYEQKPNSGSLFRNEKQREGKQDAEYTGSAIVDGVEYWVNAWVNEVQSGDKKGKKYFSMKFKAKEQRSEGSSQKPQPADEDEDIPF
jgi:hypothetical protein